MPTEADAETSLQHDGFQLLQYVLALDKCQRFSGSSNLSLNLRIPFGALLEKSDGRNHILRWRKCVDPEFSSLIDAHGADESLLEDSWLGIDRKSDDHAVLRRFSICRRDSSRNLRLLIQDDNTENRRWPARWIKLDRLVSDLIAVWESR